MNNQNKKPTSKWAEHIRRAHHAKELYRQRQRIALALVLAILVPLALWVAADIILTYLAK